MCRVIVIVGGSTTGKTGLAYALAEIVRARAVVCGDQWQLVAGFPLATGIADGAHSHLRRELYAMLPPVSAPPSSATYAAILGDVLRRYPTGCIVIDSLSLAYFPVIHLLRQSHQVLVIGLRPNWLTMPFRVVRRMWNAWRAGAVTEIRTGAQKYGAHAWYLRNSFVAQNLTRYGFFLGGALILWKGLTGEAIRGKHRRIVASGAVDVWV
jgi:hypothetical protein